MPGFTEQSQVPKMFAAAGPSYADLLDKPRPRSDVGVRGRIAGMDVFRGIAIRW